MNSRDKQQGDPEICREFVTIPMVQSVYGSQPQIRAGIGPTEHVRPVSERELVKRLTPFMTDDRSWMQGSVRKILSIINDYVRQQSVPDAQLELAIEMGGEWMQERNDVPYYIRVPRPTPDDVRKRFAERSKR